MEKMRKKKEERMHVQSNKRKRKVMCTVCVMEGVHASDDKKDKIISVI
jgi:hypothetical protein